MEKRTLKRFTYDDRLKLKELIESGVTNTTKLAKIMGVHRKTMIVELRRGGCVIKGTKPNSSWVGLDPRDYDPLKAQIKLS